MKAKTRNIRHKKLSQIGALCKQWRINQRLRLADIANYGLSVQSISNFEYGLNDSVIAYFCYTERGYKGV